MDITIIAEFTPSEVGEIASIVYERVRADQCPDWVHWNEADADTQNATVFLVMKMLDTTRAYLVQLCTVEPEYVKLRQWCLSAAQQVRQIHTSSPNQLKEIQS